MRITLSTPGEYHAKTLPGVFAAELGTVHGGAKWHPCCTRGKLATIVKLIETNINNVIRFSTRRDWADHINNGHLIYENSDINIIVS